MYFSIVLSWDNWWWIILDGRKAPLKIFFLNIVLFDLMVEVFGLYTKNVKNLISSSGHQPLGDVDASVEEFCPKLNQKRLGSQHSEAMLAVQLGSAG